MAFLRLPIPNTVSAVAGRSECPPAGRCHAKRGTSERPRGAACRQRTDRSLRPHRTGRTARRALPPAARSPSNVSFHAAACSVAVLVSTPSRSNKHALIPTGSPAAWGRAPRAAAPRSSRSPMSLARFAGRGFVDRLHTVSSLPRNVGVRGNNEAAGPLARDAGFQEVRLSGFAECVFESSARRTLDATFDLELILGQLKRRFEFRQRTAQVLRRNGRGRVVGGRLRRERAPAVRAAGRRRARHARQQAGPRRRRQRRRWLRDLPGRHRDGGDEGLRARGRADRPVERRRRGRLSLVAATVDSTTRPVISPARADPVKLRRGEAHRPAARRADRRPRGRGEAHRRARHGDLERDDVDEVLALDLSYAPPFARCGTRC